MADIDAFNLEFDLPKFLESMLQKAENILQNVGEQTQVAAEVHAEVADQTVSLIRTLQGTSDIQASDMMALDSLAGAFTNMLTLLWNHIATSAVTPTTLATSSVTITKKWNEKRPCFEIPAEMLEELRTLGFSWTKIAELLGVLRWTVARRVDQYGLGDVRGFDHLSDEEPDEIISTYIANHGTAVGQNYVGGHLRSLGLRIQRSRVRKSIARVDPQNTALRWGLVVSRRTYHVPWPNSLWHLDGHHSMIRWKIVIHGCIDGFSRRVIFLRCNSNNLAETVLELFLAAIQRDGNLWPSRIRVDKGVENVLVCDAMVQVRGHGRGSFIAGPSTHNQRTERLWRDVFRCVCHLYYYIFYAMEYSGVLDVANSIHLFNLHLIFIPRINKALADFTEAFNNHNVRTESNWTPNQMWTNGMMHPDNPLSHDQLDDYVSDLAMYGYDAQGPSTIDSDNNVVIEPVLLDNSDVVKSFVLENIEPLSQSCEMGIDLYMEAPELVLLKTEELNAQ